MTLYPAKTSAPKAYGRSFVVAHATGTAGFSISGGCRKSAAGCNPESLRRVCFFLKSK